LAVSAAGVLSLTDYFEPGDYVSLDQRDQDLGSGGIALLNSSVFNGNGVTQIGVVVGKSGTIYVVNADNLGGYKEGLNQSDAVIQTLQMPKGVWGGCGAYNLEVCILFSYAIPS
jgi:iron transport multicopper oxidase